MARASDLETKGYIEPKTKKALSNASRDMAAAGEEYGQRVATLAVEEAYGQDGVLERVDSGGKGPGVFDQVWKKTKKADEATDEIVKYIVVESKAGEGSLDYRMHQGAKVQQGSGAYFDSILESMRKKGPESAALADDLSQARSEGRLHYILVRPITEEVEEDGEVKLVYRGYKLTEFDVSED